MLIIGVGGRFDDRVIGTPSTFGNGAKIIHIDVNPNNVGLTIKPDVVLIGDANDVLSKLMKNRISNPSGQPQPSPWSQHVFNLAHHSQG